VDGLRIVEPLLAHGASFEQATHALHVARRVGDALLGRTQGGPSLGDFFGAKPGLHFGQPGAGGGRLRLRGLKPGGQFAAVEPGQLVAVLDSVAFADADGFDAPGYLKAEIGLGGLHGPRSENHVGIVISKNGVPKGCRDYGQYDGRDGDLLLVHRAISKLPASHSGVSSPMTRASSTRASISAC
jgi:hypothetical protein